jgi:hypothetical protein
MGKFRSQFTRVHAGAGAEMVLAVRCELGGCVRQQPDSTTALRALFIRCSLRRAPRRKTSAAGRPAAIPV